MRRHGITVFGNSGLNAAPRGKDAIARPRRRDELFWAAGDEFLPNLGAVFAFSL
jgi:hypothetical protein